jgi:hypothetical protein
MVPPSGNSPGQQRPSNVGQKPAETLQSYIFNPIVSVFELHDSDDCNIQQMKRNTADNEEPPEAGPSPANVRQIPDCCQRQAKSVWHENHQYCAWTVR